MRKRKYFGIFCYSGCSSNVLFWLKSFLLLKTILVLERYVKQNIKYIAKKKDLDKYETEKKTESSDSVLATFSLVRIYLVFTIIFSVITCTCNSNILVCSVGTSFWSG